jgi:hypothetical protein
VGENEDPMDADDGSHLQHRGAVLHERGGRRGGPVAQA